MSDKPSSANTAAAAGFQNAEAYEKVMGRWSQRLASLLIRFGGLSDGDRVLDVGCGTGSLTFAVPKLADVSGVTGIDLTQASSRLPHLGIPTGASTSSKATHARCLSRTTASTGHFRCLCYSSSLTDRAQWLK